MKKIDLEILQLLEIWGALGLGQLEGFFRDDIEVEKISQTVFNERCRYRGKFYLRIRRLERKGLVETRESSFTKLVYQLTQKGHALATRGLKDPPTRPQFTAPGMLRHRIVCGGVGLFISRFIGIPVQSERQAYFTLLKNLGKRPVGYHIPDLIAFGSRGRCPIEVELNVKSSASYPPIIDFYRDALRGNDRLLYLLEDTNETGRLLRFAKKEAADFLYACDLPTFRLSLGKAAFFNCEEEGFVLA